MATTSSMFMYSLTIQPPSAISQGILGQFAGGKEQQIVTACGSRLTLHRPDATQGKITPILSHDVFGIIRSVSSTPTVPTPIQPGQQQVQVYVTVVYSIR